MAEWSIAPVLKTGRLARVSGVQIPLSPPFLHPNPHILSIPHFRSEHLLRDIVSLAFGHPWPRESRRSSDRKCGIHEHGFRAKGWRRERRERRVGYRRWGSQFCHGSSVSCDGKIAQTGGLPAGSRPGWAGDKNIRMIFLHKPEVCPQGRGQDGRDEIPLPDVTGFLNACLRAVSSQFLSNRRWPLLE